MKILIELSMTEPAPGDEAKLEKKLRRELKLQFGSAFKGMSVLAQGGYIPSRTNGKTVDGPP